MWVVFASWRWMTVATIKAAAFEDPCGLVPDAQVVVTTSIACVVDGCSIAEHRCVAQADRCCGAGVLHGVQWKFVNPIQSCRRVGTIPWANGVTRDTTASDIDIGGRVSNQRDIGHRAAISRGPSGVEFPLRDQWRNGKSGAGASEGDATDSDERSLHFNGLWSFLRVAVDRFGAAPRGCTRSCNYLAGFATTGRVIAAKTPEIRELGGIASRRRSHGDTNVNADKPSGSSVQSH